LFFFDLWAQNLTIPYGKVHRIDVDNVTGNLPYGIPASNPFVGNTKGYVETIYAWGFRNPYRLSFDSLFYRSGTEKPANGHYPFWISSPSETLFDSTIRVDEPGNYGKLSALSL
jgi:Glucose / Sorbosone dehydrogenase